MNKHRFFRALVCFLVICCILINCSPIRAKAVVTEAIVVTGAGVFATMFAVAMGIVAVDLTVQLINGIGDSMTKHLYQWGSSAEKLDEVESFLTLLPPQFDNSSDDDGGDDGSEDPSANTFVIPTDILDGLIDWAKGLINGDGIEVDADVSESEPPVTSISFVHIGSTYSVTSSGPFVLGVRHYISDGSQVRSFTICSGPSQISFNFGSKVYSTSLDSATGFYFYNLLSTSGSDIFSSDYAVDGSYFFADSFVASSSSAFRTALANYYNGTKETVVYPDFFVGDIPQQVKDGTFDEEKYELPYINYTQLFQGQTDPVTALNSLSSQLQNQTMTYEQYMEQIKTEVDTNTGTDPGEDDTEQWKPPTDPTGFALDLRKFFPFCIPFDLYAFFTCLNADPVTPVIEWEIMLPGGSTYPLTIDLSPFNPIAQLLRRLELLAFFVGLAFKTRDLIRG